MRRIKLVFLPVLLACLLGVGAGIGISWWAANYQHKKDMRLAKSLASEAATTVASNITRYRDIGALLASSTHKYASGKSVQKKASNELFRTEDPTYTNGILSLIEFNPRKIREAITLSNYHFGAIFSAHQGPSFVTSSCVVGEAWSIVPKDSPVYTGICNEHFLRSLLNMNRGLIILPRAPLNPNFSKNAITFLIALNNKEDSILLTVKKNRIFSAPKRRTSDYGLYFFLKAHGVKQQLFVDPADTKGHWFDPLMSSASVAVLSGNHQSLIARAVLWPEDGIYIGIIFLVTAVVLSFLLMLLWFFWGVDALQSNKRDAASQSLNLLTEGFYRRQLDSQVTFANEALLNMFLCERLSEFAKLADKFVNRSRYDELQEIITTTGEYRNEQVEYRRSDGSEFVGHVSERLLRSKRGKPLYCEGAIRDISSRIDAQRKIEFLSHYDPLTGLANRTIFDERFQAAAASAERYHYQLALVIVNFDHFKGVNDLYGREVGDQVLIEAARRLNQTVRADDSIARFGSDEFGVLLTRITDCSDALKVINVINQRLADDYVVGKTRIRLRPSVGVAFYPRDGADLGSLSKNADTAMSQVKQSVQAQYIVYSEQLGEKAQRRLELEKALQQALEGNEFRVALQPRISLKNGRVTAVEALLRWSRPHWGSISPLEFIPVAEQTGMIVPLGEKVLSLALAEWKKWSNYLPEPPRIGVNISARQLHELDFPAVVNAALEVAEVPGNMLELELTESMVIEKNAGLERSLSELRQAGIILAFDDFGIGYSNLGNLKRFGIDVIKIDQSFIRDIPTDPNDLSIVRGIISIARDFGVELVAEGVETEEQLQILKRLRCDQVQGYLLTRPLTGSDCLEFLLDWTQSGPRAPFYWSDA